uniref:Ketosynthase family 3 (KS3) domain-containing protein n=1 Tax=Alexandrium monilatum TaxID=311494 RepID=A0A7S4Q9J2_9DINO
MEGILAGGDPHEFGMTMVDNIMTKGYCMVELPLDEQTLTQVSYEIACLDEEGKFFSPAAEVVEGLLGEEGSTRVAELRELGAGPAPGGTSALLTIDAHLDVVANAISPLAPDVFGFEMKSRTAGLLHESGTPRQAFPFISHAGAMQWFQTFTSHRIMCLVFLGPEYGTLELQPFDSDANVLEIETEPGTCVYLRADLLSHKFRAPEESYTLSCWFLQAQSASQRQLARPCFPLSPVAAALDAILNEPADEDLPGEKVPRDLQRMLHHRQRTGGKTAVRGAAVKLPCDMDFWSMYLSLSDGTDCATLIPFRKWDHDDYYDPHPSSVKFGRVNCKHSGEVEGLDLFDNKKFRISPIEAATLAPEQRQTLEVGYEVMYYAGFRKSDMEKTATGVYAGATWNEWNFIRPIDSVAQGPFGATSNMNTIPANRLSYMLGFNGASMSLDTEGASSLVAVCKGNDDISVAKERRTIDQSLCIGVSFLLSPKVLLDHAANGHLSRKGRCLTFDASADGHIIGDACGGVLLAPLAEVLQTQSYQDEHHPVRGLISASRMGNMGRAASLTAPNGPTDQRLLRTAVDSAGFSVLDVEAMECHGSGHLLVDATEVASLAKVLRGSRDAEPETLLLGSLKTCVADSRAAAGISALVKTLAAQSWGAPPPSLHLQTRNPHMDVDGHPIRFTSESSEFWTSSAYCGITSKGVGGAVAHVIAWGSVDAVLRPGVLAQPQHPELNRVDITYWPGGGGELEDDAHPNRAYTIMGSWSAWLEAEDMEEEEPGIFGCTVTLRDHCVEQFQILLDGNPHRILHPSMPQASQHSPVLGPSARATGLCWLIDGRPQKALHPVPVESYGWPGGNGSDTISRGVNGSSGVSGVNGTSGDHASLNGKHTDCPPQCEEDHGELQAHVAASVTPAVRGAPGDLYRVRLCVNGKWRTIIWDKLPKPAVEAAGEPVPPAWGTARHFLVANWNMWQLVQEMEPHPKIRGLYRKEVQLTCTGGEFQIVVNRDMDQVLYPSPDGSAGSLAHPVLGPDTALATRGMNWFLDGKPGDIFRIEYQMAMDHGAIRKAVAFRRVGHRQLTDAQVEEAARARYFIVGSWNRWNPQEMTWNGDGGYFQFQIDVGQEGREMFQILMDNDWRLVLHPESMDSVSSEVLGPTDSSQCDGINWMVSGHEGAGRTGGRYVIKLHISDEMPVRVEWVRRS